MSEIEKASRIFIQPKLPVDVKKQLNRQLYIEYLSWAQYLIYIVAAITMIIGISGLLIYRQNILWKMNICYSIFLTARAFIMRKQRSSIISTSKSGTSDYFLFIIVLAFSITATLLLLMDGINDISMYLMGILSLVCHFRASRAAILSLIAMSQIALFAAMAMIFMPYPDLYSQLYVSYIINTTIFSVMVFLIREAILSVRIKLFIRNIRLEEDSMHINKLNEILENESEGLKKLNQKLQDSSEVDTLTGLANKKKFDEMYLREWMRSIRSRETISLLLIDIGNSNSNSNSIGIGNVIDIKDGHLKNIAHSIKESARRNTDFVARYNKDQFIVLLPDTDRDGATIVAESIMRNVKALEIENNTVSIGAAALRPSKIINHGMLLEMTFKALEKANSAGRNTFFIE